MAAGGSKPATLETGAVIQVPLFIQQGERIKVRPNSLARSFISPKTVFISKRHCSQWFCMIDEHI